MSRRASGPSDDHLDPATELHALPRTLTAGRFIGVLRRSLQPFAAPPALWALVCCLAAGATALYWFGLRDLGRISAPFELPWWVIGSGYALAEVLVVNLQFRRDTHSFSLSEVPFVVGLFFLRPDQLLLALLLGSGVALALHRRQPPIKLAFNLAALALAAGLGLLLFRAILGNADPLGPLGWLGATSAAIGADVVTLVLIAVAMRMATGQSTELARVLGSGGLVAFFNTCLALVTVTVVSLRPEASWLPLVLSGLLVAAYRIYGSLGRKHESLEVLYETTRRLHQASGTGAVIETLLHQGHELFRSDRVEVLLFAADADAATEFTFDADVGTVRTTEIAELDPREGVWARVAAEGSGLVLARPIANQRLRAYFADRGVRDLMVAPLSSQDSVVGTMLVGNRQGVVGYTQEDLQLLETFANHASSSLENVRLISSLRRHAEESHHRALHDALTALPNRVSFRQQIDRAIGDAGSSGGFAVALMDLDKFKEVNDTLGHHSGDLLLEGVADRLTRSIRAGDVVARLGGDEFGVLMPGAGDASAASVLAVRLTECLEEPFRVQDLNLEVAASVGIALYPAHGQDADTLIQRADVAMYDAKTGCLGHALYQPDRDSYNPSRLLLVGELRRALDEDGLTVMYQPKVNARDGRIVGAEALVRWHHPLRGEIPPDNFVPIAEHTGLLKPLTMFVLTTALDQCARWRATGRELSVAVNLSVRNLLDVDLPDDVATLLKRFSLPPSALELEVTESALIADPVRSHAVVHRLRDSGIGIAIDDYGTGYSSLAYIRRMPINELKIDKSFVIGMAEDENDGLIVQSTIDLAHNLGLRVVAEGVETETAWRRLVELGCDLAQGYYFGAAQSPAGFEELLRVEAAPARPVPARRRVTRTPILRAVHSRP